MAGSDLSSGGPFQRPDDVFVDSYYADQHKYHVGDTVSELNRRWRLAGIYEPGMLARLVVSLDTLQESTATGQSERRLRKAGRSGENRRSDCDLEGALWITRLIHAGVHRSFSVNSVPMLKEFTIVVIALGVLVGFLVVFLSMYTAVLERTREIGVLKALGASPGYVLNILLRETLLLAVAGSMLGIAALLRHAIHNQ